MRVLEWCKISRSIRLGLECGETRATKRLTNMNRTQALCDLLVLIFRRCSERQPIVVALDDVQWMDVASW